MGASCRPAIPRCWIATSATTSHATSHAELDADPALFEEVRNAACTLVEGVVRYRAGERPPGAELREPRPK